MVAGESPEWLPPGFGVKIKYRDGKKIKYYLHVATGKKYYSKKDVINSATEENGQLLTPPTKTGDNNGPSSIHEVDAISEKTNDSAAWLPNGWTVEERKRKSGSGEGSAYKVYTELTSGSKFYSKIAVTRYLSSINHAETKQNKIDTTEPLQDVSPQVAPVTSPVNTRGKKRKGDSLAIVCAMIDKVDELVVEKYPQPISMINTGGIHEQKMKGKSLVTNENVGKPSLDMSPQVISTTNTDRFREKKRKASSCIMVTVDRTPDELPSDWTKEVWISKSGNKTRKDPYYIDPVSGYMFRSKPDALRYLKTNDIRSCAIKPLKRDPNDIKSTENKASIDNAEEPVPEKSPQTISTTNTTAIHEQNTKGKSHAMIDNVGEPSPDTSPQAITTPKTDGVHQKKRKGSSSVTVTIEKALDGFPSGWTKEIRTRKCRNMIRKDPYYIDPVSGYMFRSKPDALRYLETNDIRSCALKPLRRDSNGIDHANLVEENSPKPETDLSQNGVKIEAMNKQQSPQSVGRSKIVSRKSKKTKDSILPTRASKRLAGSQAEMQNGVDLNERSIRAASRGFTASDVDTSPSSLVKPSETIPQTSNLEQAKEAVDKEVEKVVAEEPSGEKPQSEEEELFYDFGDSWSDPLEFALKTLRGELPIEHTPTLPSSPTLDKVDECLKQSQSGTLVRFQTEQSQSDAVDECLKQSQSDAPVRFQTEQLQSDAPVRFQTEQLQSDAPVRFQTELDSTSESSKKNDGLDPSPLFPAVGNVGFSHKPSGEVGKKDSQTIFKP